MAIKAAKAKKSTKKEVQAPSAPSSTSSSSTSDSSSDDEAPPARKSEVAKGKQRESEDDESSSASSSASEESEDEAEPLLDLDKIRKRMHHAVRHLASSAKKVRKFETQRLIKRIKSSHPDLSSLETQLTALKSLDMVSLASTALLGKLGKAKLLPRGVIAKEYRTEDAKSSQLGQTEWPLLAGVWSEDPLAEAWLASAEPTTGPQDEAGKVKARLLSSKVLADECGKMVETLGRLAGRSQNGKTEQPAKVEAVEEPLPESKCKAIAPKKVEKDEERIWSGSEGGASDSEDDQSELEEDSDSDDDAAADDLDEDAIQAKLAELGDLDKWDALVAAGSDGDADDGSDVDEQQAGPSSSSKRKRSPSPRPAVAKKRQAAQVAEPSSSEGEEVDSEEDSEAESDDESSSSYGLPALSHGFLAQRLRTKDDDFSGSESGSDDDDPIDDQAEDKAAKAAKGSKASKERKNRMGQRARKALWEKKYGRNANHVKLQQKDKTPRPEASEGQPAFKPLRRGRDGKLLPDFEAPKEVDSGWKKFPVATTPADAAPSASVTKGKRPDASAPPRKALRPQQNTYVPKGDYRMDTNGAAPAGSGPSRAKAAPAAPQQEMHPSWVAKQKQKEKEEMIARSLAGGGGAGKKVTFD